MTTREFQLLLRCARSQPDVGSVRDLVNQGVNWKTLIELARRHGVRPMLFQSLKSACWDSVSQAAQLELEHFYMTNVTKNLLFTRELLRLLGLIRQDGIPVATLKGAVLADSVYGALPLREFCDLDLLVHQADVNKVEDILTACGYQADFPDRDYRSAFLSYPGQYAFRQSQTGISIDLHWRLTSKIVAFPLDSAGIWPKLVQVTIAGRTVPTLAHDDLALFLAAHGTKEGWLSLKWVCDFAELLRKYQDIDWVAVLDRAHRSHSSRSLLLATDLAPTLFDPPPPPPLAH